MSAPMEEALATACQAVEDERGLPDDARAAVRALQAGVTIERAIEALEALRAPAGGRWFEEVADGLARSHREIFLAIALPGVRFEADLDVRTSRTSKSEENWHGDLLIELATAVPGAAVIVGSVHGARALAAVDRALVAPIVHLSTVFDDARGHGVLEGLRFDGVRSLRLDVAAASVAAALVRGCPMLEEYVGRARSTVELAAALAETRTLRTASLPDADDEALACLAAAPALTHLSLSRSARRPAFGIAGLAGLARHASLRRLDLGSCGIGDDEAGVIATVAPLERLGLGGNPLGDRGGGALAGLTRLRMLDLHATNVGDAAARALAAVTTLVELDLSESRVGADGVRALASAPALRRLGLAWDTGDDVRAAAGAFAEGVVAWNDPIIGGSALWPPPPSRR